jgi:riboflavin synthase
VAEPFLKGVAVGDSIAVDGACLTPVEVEAGSFEIDAVGTTLSRTVAGSYRVGSEVNLEKALSLGGRLDGHLVQGHIDGTGHLIQTVKAGEYWLMEVELPPEVHRMTIPHGSITLNGVSLTVNRLLTDPRIEVAIIPHTWARTNLHSLHPGDPLNVEGDLIGKYVGRLLTPFDPPSADAGPAPGERE